MDLTRFETFKENYCWQYKIRLDNKESDLKELRESGFDGKVEDLRVSDFNIRLLETEKEKNMVTKFIEKHEWLGDISLYTTHWFGCFHNETNILSGVLLFNTPNAFMKIGDLETKKLERLISRGACISWSPKNLGSWMIKQCITWMTKNTPYRIFSCYSDTTAKELGTIYQACNFYYLGKKFGATKKYINPYNGHLISDRMFRMRSMYKKYAIDLGIEWDKSWNKDSKMLWENMPNDVEEKLREYGKKKQSESEFIIIPPKHKYIFVQGSDNRETKYLRKIVLENIKTLSYPKER